MDRYPYPFIEMNPQDMAELNLKAGDLVEVYNDNGSTQAMAYPTPTGEAEADLHAVRLPDRRAGQRRLGRRERVHHPELQADLGATSARSPTRPKRVRGVSFKEKEYTRLA